MKKSSFIFLIFFISSLLIIGCSANVAEEYESEEVLNTESENGENVEEEEDVVAPPVVQEEKPAEIDTDVESEMHSEEEVNLGSYDVYIGGEVIEEEAQIIIHGESNLLPGARVIGEVLVGDEEEQEYFSDTSEIVQEDGTFYMELAHHDLKEETQVSVKFHFDGQQDDGIKRHYGDRGQKLEGAYVYKHQGEVGGGKPQNIFNQAKVMTTFEPSEEKAIRYFKKPQWHSIPEDMGDPRVWIEVDEINNDDEHFYVQGRSNLSEGASIFVRYGGWKYDDTRIFPDGSFYAKLPYEYREDTNFIVEFDPDHWAQWNEIKERYGAKGQKLIGQLVVQHKYSDKQYIEKVVEQESQLIDVPDQVELVIDGSEITMLVPDNILFDYDKYDLKKEAKETLKEISKTLESSFNKKDFDIIISGHTDNTGTKEYNKKLSKQRADEVKNYFEKQLNSTEITFTTEGYGDTKPIASNDTEDGQAKNRRVEIIINLADQ